MPQGASSASGKCDGLLSAVLVNETWTRVIGVSNDHISFLTLEARLQSAHDFVRLEMNGAPQVNRT